MPDYSPPHATSASTASQRTLRRNGTRRAATAWHWLLVLAILVFTTGNVYLGYDSQRQLSTDYDALERVYQDLILLDRVLLLIVDAETGQRGYILTREPSYREPYDDALGNLESAMMQLHEQLLEYQHIYLLYGPFEVAINAKVRELGSTLRYVEENDFNAGDIITEANRGQQYMKNIRDTGDTIQSALNVEARALEAAKVRKQTRTITSLGSAAAASVILLWALVAFGRRDTERKEQLNDLLISRNEQLDAAVQERTRELELANEQYDRSNRELENFAYVVSHDLQEPLRKIRAFGDRLVQTQESELSERSLNYIDRMQSAALRMSTLLDDLLQFSRVNTRGMDWSRINLNELVSTVLEDLELFIEEKEAHIECGLLPHVRGDLTQLRQLFQNLIGNGLKFQPPGQPPRIEIACEISGDEAAGNEIARIDIRDNGIGFEERYLDRIFDPFQRLHGRSEYEGSGIGLAICRRVAERHGGELNARSVPGEGSVFTITIPLDTDATIESESPKFNTEE